MTAPFVARPDGHRLFVRDWGERSSCRADGRLGHGLADLG
jgi:hypothetical protein